MPLVPTTGATVPPGAPALAVVLSRQGRGPLPDDRLSDRLVPGHPAWIPQARAKGLLG